MLSGVFGPTMQIGASLFAFMIVGLGIPLFSVLTRMNLTGGDGADDDEGGGLCCSNNGGMTNRMANILAVYLPWSISWLLYRGSAITVLLGWGGVLFTSMVAFLFPLMLAFHTTVEFDTSKSLSTDIVDGPAIGAGSIRVYGGWFESRSVQIIDVAGCLCEILCLTVPNTQ